MHWDSISRQDTAGAKSTSRGMQYWLGADQPNKKRPNEAQLLHRRAARPEGGGAVHDGWGYTGLVGAAEPQGAAAVHSGSIVMDTTAEALSAALAGAYRQHRPFPATPHTHLPLSAEGPSQETRASSPQLPGQLGRRRQA